MEDRSRKNEIFGGNAPAGVPTRNVMKDDFGFEVPTEAVPLPSNGLVYPVESAMHKKELVSIRAMTAREEDILTSKALIKKGTVISALLKSAILEDGFDPDEMLSGDRNAVMIALRITGYGTSYRAEVDCPACGERSKQDFDLSELPIKRLEVEPVSPGANLFEVELPVTHKKVRFKFLTGLDEMDLAAVTERRKKLGQVSDNLVTTRLQYAIQSIDGINDKNKIQMFIKNMPAKDSLFLRRFIDENEPGIEMKGWMDCSSCHEHSEVRLPLGASFFWPES